MQTIETITTTTSQSPIPQASTYLGEYENLGHSVLCQGGEQNKNKLNQDYSPNSPTQYQDRISSEMTSLVISLSQKAKTVFHF